MSEPFVGEIRMFAGNFAPRGWAFCDGQLLAVSQNDALFSLFGTIYGGDGRTTFALPDLRGRVPIHAGHGTGLSQRRLGSKAGQEKVTLTVNQLPTHNHEQFGTASTTPRTQPGGNLPVSDGLITYFRNSNVSPVTMASDMITPTGGSRSHTNIQPFLCVHFIVALFGIYPSRH
jgi:microcystin-dependent protein